MTAFTRMALYHSVVACFLVLGSPRPFVYAQPPATAPGNAPPAHRSAPAAQDPDNDQYDKLVEAERRYRRIADDGGWPAVPDGDAMKPGLRYDCSRIVALEKRLAAEGYQGSTDRARQPDRARKAPAPVQVKAASTDTSGGCEYGGELVASVEDFQYDRYLVDDGIVGGQTLRQLGKPVQDSLAKIDYALQRWRANASNLIGSYILVNIPAFELTVFEGRREVLRMPVIVGLPDWQTPELSDKIDYLVINPSWNIPKSIADAEVLPKGKRDPGYYKREGISFDGDGTLSQKPGPRNPLGRLKFMMPNRQDIYLHDTPGKQRFAAPSRAFSHGCIRVQKPVELAAYLLKGDPQWSQQRIQSAIDSKTSRDVKLPQPMAVHLLYMPAQVSADGRVRVLPDIYDKVGNAKDESVSEPAPTEEDEFLPGWP